MRRNRQRCAHIRSSASHISCDDVVTLTAHLALQQAQNYARMGRVSGQLAPIGGIGGSSVRIAPQLTTVHLFFFFLPPTFLLIYNSHV
jgi:hypothetical protein